MYPLKVSMKYDPSNLANLGHIYTVPYMWNYIPWEYWEFSWSHPWVDIFPEKSNDDVFCVLDGEVYKTWEDVWYGKYIFIKHKNVPNPDNFSLKTTLYSCYLHLSEVFVEDNDILKEWHIIWKTWNTWISFWEHLHFQIDRDTAPYHAYWPYDWSDVKASWVSFSEWVNLKLWYENALKYTINPLVYLDQVKNNSEVWVTWSVEVVLDWWNFSTNITKDYEINDLNINWIYYKFIKELIDKKVFNLDENNNFFPDRNITRWEFLKVIFLYNNTEISKDESNYFWDIPDNFWQKKYVNTAVKLSIISKDNLYFKPNDDISRVEAIKIYLKLLNITAWNPLTSKFDDINISDWSLKYAQYASNKNVFEVDNNFYPNKPISRYELAKILYLIKK